MRDIASDDVKGTLLNWIIGKEIKIGSRKI